MDGPGGYILFSDIRQRKTNTVRLFLYMKPKKIKQTHREQMSVCQIGERGGERCDE